LAEHVGRQKMPVVLIAAKKTPSNDPSRSARARYIVSVEGSEVVVMARNLEAFFQRFHRKLNTEFSDVKHISNDRAGGQMNDELQDKWESIEKELKAAMSKLSEAIEKARADIPEAAKAINDEYLKMQEKLDRAVDKIRK
jgi:gas vesicle protein